VKGKGKTGEGREKEREEGLTIKPSRREYLAVGAQACGDLSGGSGGISAM